MHTLVQKYLNLESEEIKTDEFQRLVELGETSNIERKSIRDFDNIDQNKNGILELLGKTVSAFANYNGGILLIGVDDKTGKIEDGVDNSYGTGTVKEWLEDIVAKRVDFDRWEDLEACDFKIISLSIGFIVGMLIRRTLNPFSFILSAAWFAE